MKQYIPCVSRQYNVKIDVDDILAIQQKERKLRIVTETQCYEYYERIDNIKPFLDQRFCPCLKTLYINLEKVQRMEEQTVYFYNGLQLPLARGSYIRTKQQYAAYLRALL